MNLNCKPTSILRLTCSKSPSLNHHQISPMETKTRPIMAAKHVGKQSEEVHGIILTAANEEPHHIAVEDTITVNASTEASLACESTSSQPRMYNYQASSSISTPEEEVPRFESFPPEVRNKIYRYLLSTESYEVNWTGTTGSRYKKQPTNFIPLSSAPITPSAEKHMVSSIMTTFSFL